SASAIRKSTATSGASRRLNWSPTTTSPPEPRRRHKADRRLPCAWRSEASGQRVPATCGRLAAPRRRARKATRRCDDAGTPSDSSPARSSKEPRRESSSVGAGHRAPTSSVVLPKSPIPPPIQRLLRIATASESPDRRDRNGPAPVSALTNRHFCHRYRTFATYHVRVATSCDHDLESSGALFVSRSWRTVGLVA